MSHGRHRVALALCAALALSGCGGRSTTPDPRSAPGVRTIEQAADVPALPLSTDITPAALSASAAPLVGLPFTPAISMDPVDGGKVSIRPDTPLAEFNDRVYYFRSEENRQAFLRNPEKYAGGTLSKY
ncbi:MAG: hypothetical protein ACSLFQ_03025 [Thermoanaerobaculia bacterium]